jgi:flagellar hook-associated protein 3 FlgL
MIGTTRLSRTLDIARQQRLATDIRRDQTEISTERRIQTPSDDPVGAGRVATIVRTLSDTASWRANADRAATLSAGADTVMASTGTLLDAAASALLGARSGLQSLDARTIVANQLRSIAEEVATLSATRDADGNRIFPDDSPLAIPVGDNRTITASMAMADAFAVGGQSFADTLTAAADALLIADDTARGAAVASSIDAINRAVTHATEARGIIGIAAERIERERDRLTSDVLTLTEQRNSIEGADIATVIARLQGRQVSLEAAQAVFARINRQTLFDLLG